MSGTLRFADFELRVQQRQLLHRGHRLQTGGRALDLLILLVEQRHRIVGKDELIDHCWSNQAVEPNNLAVQIWALRRLLGAEAIVTVPGRGYQFVANTRVVPAGAEAAAGAPSTSAPLPRALPQLAPMFGRADDLARLLALLQTHRLLTLLGPPGVGKTRLAHAVVAQRLQAAEPALLVDLAKVAEASQVDAALREALGVADAGPGQADMLGWLGLLAGRPLLLVLDNCEHLSDAVATLAGVMLAQLPALRLLATSQRPLGLAVEQRLRLQPLALPASPPATSPALARSSPALQLLVARVQALEPEFQLADADLPTAMDLCRRLDGLPLAIELAAARVPALGLQGVQARLDARLQVLTRGAAPHRHASLAEALDWSVSLLPEPAKALLAALGVGQGSLCIDLALQMGQAVGLDEAAAFDALAHLANHSLVLTETQARMPRLCLLDSVRAHALASLRARGQLERLQQHHAQALCSLLAHRGLARERGQISDDAALEGVRQDLNNIRAAMGWVLAAPERAPVGHSILADAWPAMFFLGLYHEAMGWMLALQPRLTADTPARTAGYVLLGLGMMALRLQKPAPAQRHALLQRSQVLLDTLGRTEYAMAVRHALAHSACQLGRPQDALAAADAALALLQPDDRANHRAILSIARGIALALLGRQTDAEAALAEALPLCVPEHNGDLLFMLQCNLALLELLLGRHAAAAGRYADLTEAATARGMHSHVAAPLWAGLQASLLSLGDVDGARSAASETWRHMATVGQPLEGCLVHAWQLALAGQTEAALQLLGAGDRQLLLSGEARLVFEPMARSRLLDCLGDAADTPQGLASRRQGATLTPAQVHDMLTRVLVATPTTATGAVGASATSPPATAPT